MYLSQLILNPRERSVLGDLSDPYQMHRSVMSGFPTELPTDERVLYRLEIKRNQPNLTLLIQSHSLPEWQDLFDRGYLLQPARVKPVEYTCTNGQTFRFRLLSNPTRRIRKDEDGKTTRVGLQREADQLQWLNRKGSQHGFCVLTARTAKITQPDGWKEENGRKFCISYFAVQFDGILQVTDCNTFLHALAYGVGGGKGMGFGLLSIAQSGE